MDRASYRARQFLRAVMARPRPEDLASAGAILGPELYDLFLRLPPPDQAHALQVYRSLQRQGHRHPDVLAAGLLHDVGKSPLPLRHLDRVAVVLGQAFLPGRARAWQAGDPAGWRRGFVVACHHPEWGATMVAQAGGSERLVALVRNHQTGTGSDPSLAALQAADGDS
ncbi:MAG: HD domain-containing protein [Anaerolineales bacterium]|nr:HD domain-containing protein [Anaerolineales bacterium]